jgi:hypothetical protein
MLSARDATLLKVCYQHRLLTTRQVHLLLYPGEVRRTAQKALHRLARAGLVASGARSVTEEAVWFATEAGASLAETGKVTARRHRMTGEQAVGRLRDHTLEANEVGLAFVLAARAREMDECGPGAWEHEIGFRVSARRSGQTGSDITPDAVLEYTIGAAGRHEVVTRFIEVDRSTMPPGRFATKLRVYVQLYNYKPKHMAGPPTPHGYNWEHKYLVFPKVLVVLCDHPDGHDAAQLARRRERLLGLCALDPVLERARMTGQVVITFTTLRELVEKGPFEPIFWTPGAEGPADVIGESSLPAQLAVEGLELDDGDVPASARRPGRRGSGTAREGRQPGRRGEADQLELAASWG